MLALIIWLWFSTKFLHCQLTVLYFVIDFGEVLFILSKYSAPHEIALVLGLSILAYGFDGILLQQRGLPPFCLFVYSSMDFKIMTHYH